MNPLVIQILNFLAAQSALLEASISTTWEYNQWRQTMSTARDHEYALRVEKELREKRDAAQADLRANRAKLDELIMQLGAENVLALR